MSLEGSEQSDHLKEELDKLTDGAAWDWGGDPGLGYFGSRLVLDLGLARSR
jgi:hypothetical protein